MRSVTLAAVKRPPGDMPIMTRPSPDLFGLIDATSNCGSLPDAGGLPPCCADGMATAAIANAASRILRTIVNVSVDETSVLAWMFRTIDDEHLDRRFL